MKHVDNERDFFDDVLRHIESHGLVEHRTGRGVLDRRLLLADLLTSTQHRRLHECICTEERTQTRRSTDRGVRDTVLKLSRNAPERHTGTFWKGGTPHRNLWRRSRRNARLDT